MARIRIHQHVNPLAPFYRSAPEPLAVERVFARPALPLHLDIGSARGRFLLKMAQIEPDKNYLGVEIREPLVAEANRLATERNLSNLRYEFCNASHALDVFLENLPADILDRVTVQFPDPWYKKKHAKRRMLNEKIIETVVRHLKPAGKIFIQTDVDFLAEEMFAVARQNSFLQEFEISENPFPVRTERENAVEEKNLPIYRRLFEKTEKVRSEENG